MNTLYYVETFILASSYVLLWFLVFAYRNKHTDGLSEFLLMMEEKKADFAALHTFCKLICEKNKKLTEENKELQKELSQYKGN